LSFAENAAKTSGTLTIADAALRASITLFGNYAAAGFHLSAGTFGGTAITYSTSGSAGHADIAPGHG
jgi:hypothetical protein